jgi:hypothetical protein
VLAAADLATGALVPASARRMATDTPYRLAWPARRAPSPAFVALRAHLAGGGAPPVPHAI